MLLYKVSVKYANNTHMVVHNSFNCIKDLLNKYIKNKVVKDIEINVVVKQPQIITHSNPAIKQPIDNDWEDDIDTLDYGWPGYMFY